MSQSEAKGLSDLPTELLLHIFDYLEPKEICTISETCSKFKEIIDDADKLVNKLTLYVKYPLNVKSFAETMKNSSRPYSNLKITRDSKNEDDYLRKPADVKKIFKSVASLIKNLEVNWSGYHAASSEMLQAKMAAANVNAADERQMRLELIFSRDQDFAELRIQPGNTEREGEAIRTVQERANVIQGLRTEVKKLFFQEFVSIIGEFSSLETLKFSNVTTLDVSNDFEPLENLSSVRELSIKQSDLFVCSKLLQPCVNLVKLSASDPFNGFVMNVNQRDGFDIFLTSLEKLKELTLSNVRSFFRDSHPDIKFKLNALKLSDVFFTNQGAADKFFSSQDQLKAIDFHMKNEFSRFHHLEDLIPRIRFENILKTSKLLKEKIFQNFLLNLKFCSFPKQQASRDCQIVQRQLCNR